MLSRFNVDSSHHPSKGCPDGSVLQICAGNLEIKLRLPLRIYGAADEGQFVRILRPEQGQLLLGAVHFCEDFPCFHKLPHFH